MSVATKPRKAAVRTKTRSVIDNGRSLDIENQLTKRFHVEWEFQSNVPTSRFDFERGLKNQARIEPLNPQVVALYKAGVLRGDNFPAVIAYRAGDKLVIADGNHRLAAHKDAGALIDVYVLADDTNPHIITLISVAPNAHHGDRTTEAERVRHALDMINNDGASQRAAAAAANVPEAKLRVAIANEAGDLRADTVRFPRNKWENILSSGRHRLLTITTDEIFREAVELVYEGHLVLGEIATLVEELNGERSIKKQRGILEDHRQAMRARIQAKGAGVLGSADRRIMGPKARAILARGQVKALGEPAAIAKTFAPAERPDAAQSFLDAGAVLMNIGEAIKALDNG